MKTIHKSQNQQRLHKRDVRQYERESSQNTLRLNPLSQENTPNWLQKSKSPQKKSINRLVLLSFDERIDLKCDLNIE